MKSSFPTLIQIREAIKDQGEVVIAAFDRDVKLLETKVKSLEEKMDKRFDEVDKRFDRVEDKIQSLDERLIIQSERTRKLERHPFATL